jgi:hypothetical protein
MTASQSLALLLLGRIAANLGIPTEEITALVAPQVEVATAAR